MKPEQPRDSIVTSMTLLQRVRDEDRVAWDVFAKLYGPVIYRWSRSCGLQDSDAADIAQDVLITVAAKIDSFQREKSGQSLRGWMRTITKNKSRDLLRAKQRHATAAGGTDAQLQISELPGTNTDDASEEDDLEDQASVVHAAAELLKAEFEEHTWKAFVQTAMEGRKAADVAADLGMSVGGVYTAKSRVLSRLRSEFEGLL